MTTVPATGGESGSPYVAPRLSVSPALTYAPFAGPPASATVGKPFAVGCAEIRATPSFTSSLNSRLAVPPDV
jgi:hypothetical protein